VEAGVGERDRERGKGKNKIKTAGPTFGGGIGGPPRMEGGKGNLEGRAKWRSI
jgi:hypothetical protein